MAGAPGLEVWGPYAEGEEIRAAIVEGKAGSIMCAYNAINGEPACANQYLLQDQLRGKWGFKGYVVSDCAAVRDVAANHRYRPSQAQGAAA